MQNGATPLILLGLRHFFHDRVCCMESLPGNFFDFFIQFFGLVVFFVQAKAKNSI